MNAKDSAPIPLSEESAVEIKKVLDLIKSRDYIKIVDLKLSSVTKKGVTIPTLIITTET